MSTKNVKQIFNPQAPHFVGDGFRVHNYIPSAIRMEDLNPFIMLDYNSKHYFSPSEKPRGVDIHPHRGFETVTIAYKGKIRHADNSGGGGVIEEGDVQWMTAASGVLHKEFHEEEFSKAGGDFQMVQLWVNLPAQNKMSQPKYQAIKNIEINKYTTSGVTVDVIAGEYKGIKGAASTFTPMNVLNAKLNTNATLDFNFTEGHVTVLLVLEGGIKINNTETASENQLAWLENVGQDFTISATADSVVLILNAEPIKEPIAAHGPFVMNTENEIMQAFTDFRMGKFGSMEF